MTSTASLAAGTPPPSSPLVSQAAQQQQQASNAIPIHVQLPGQAEASCVITLLSCASATARADLQLLATITQSLGGVKQAAFSYRCEHVLLKHRMAAASSGELHRVRMSMHPTSTFLLTDLKSGLAQARAAPLASEPNDSSTTSSAVEFTSGVDAWLEHTFGASSKLALVFEGDEWSCGDFVVRIGAVRVDKSLLSQIFVEVAYRASSSANLPTLVLLRQFLASLLHPRLLQSASSSSSSSPSSLSELVPPSWPSFAAFRLSPNVFSPRHRAVLVARAALVALSSEVR